MQKMKVYDISQELFSCCVFPGDPAPSYIKLAEMDDGAPYNLSEISLCTHNGTHIDAPRHYIRDGATVDELGIAQFVGMCSVVELNGAPNALIRGRHRKLLFKGDAALTESLANALVDAGVELVGVEPQTVGSGATIDAVHRILLSHGVVIVEGLRLRSVPPGDYLLSAAPLNLRGLEGAPCRAVLVDIGASI